MFEIPRTEHLRKVLIENQIYFPSKDSLLKTFVDNSFQWLMYLNLKTFF